MTDFAAYSVAHGLKNREFADLDERTKRKLVRLMARISEKSYRRGFQQGHTFREHDVATVDPAKLRFNVSLERSPYTDAIDEKGHWHVKSGHTVIERLFMEYGVLSHLGFRESTGAE
jgi:hypothetical protein